MTRLLLALVLLATCANASSQIGDSLPPVDDVVANMLRGDVERSSKLPGYTARRRYVAVNKDRRAEMVVRVDCFLDGTKQFTIISEKGSIAIREHVFYQVLNEEREASQRETREASRITPSSYRFNMIGRETLDSGPAYVLTITPKAKNRFLIDGKIWVNARDYSIVRVEGQPMQNPSFWVRSVHFVYTSQRVGQFWLDSSIHSTSEVRIFGSCELTIENFDYVLGPPTDRTAEENPTG